MKRFEILLVDQPHVGCPWAHLRPFTTADTLEEAEAFCAEFNRDELDDPCGAWAVVRRLPEIS